MIMSNTILLDRNSVLCRNKSETVRMYLLKKISIGEVWVWQISCILKPLYKMIVDV